ncbi:hypothetical protein [Paracoccus hibiscisoli]|uniref:hypothetical protein n=1 Tax=Paracoccus hibiscisoli TaxID=2023261 RepID=UPI0026C0D620
MTKKALRRDELNTITDKRCFSGREIFECREAWITTTVPRPARSGEGVWQRLDRDPDPMTLRRCAVEHPFGRVKAGMCTPTS